MESLQKEIGALASLAWPITAAQLGLTTLGLVDVAVLGRVSVTDLAGASIGRAIAFAAVALPFGVASALDPLASQAVGANEPARAWRALTATIRACALVWIPCTVLSIAATLLLPAIGIDEAISIRARYFVIGQSPGMLAFAVFMAGKSFLQAHGKTRPALVASVIANVVNVIACNLIVRGDAALADVHLPRLGLKTHGAFGAGASASIASVALVVALVPSVRAVARDVIGKETSAHVSAMRVLRLGSPIGFQFLAEIGVFSAVAVLAGRLGAEVASAHQVAIGLASFTFMGALGISGATAVRVGNAIGRGDGARKPGVIGVALGVGFMSVSATVFALLAEHLMRLFTEDPTVVRIGASLLRVAAAFQVFDGMQGVAAGALRGAGDVRFPFVANVLAHWAVGLPLALFLGFWLRMGAVGLWLGLTAGLVVVSIALAGRFLVISSRPIARV